MDLHINSASQASVLNKSIKLLFLYKTKVYSDFSVPFTKTSHAVEYWHHKIVNLPFDKKIVYVETFVKFDNLDDFLYTFVNGQQIHFNDRGRCTGHYAKDCNIYQEFHTKTKVNLEGNSIKFDLLCLDTGRYSILTNLTYYFLLYVD